MKNHNIKPLIMDWAHVPQSRLGNKMNTFKIQVSLLNDDFYGVIKFVIDEISTITILPDDKKKKIMCLNEIRLNGFKRKGKKFLVLTPRYEESVNLIFRNSEERNRARKLLQTMLSDSSESSEEEEEEDEAEEEEDEAEDEGEGAEGEGAEDDWTD